MISQGAVSSQISKATSWLYIGVVGGQNETVNMGNLVRCATNETGALNYLNSNYPASNYTKGYVIQVNSTSGFFPNQVFCTERTFRAV